MGVSGGVTRNGLWSISSDGLALDGTVPVTPAAQGSARTLQLAGFDSGT